MLLTSIVSVNNTLKTHVSVFNNILAIESSVIVLTTEPLTNRNKTRVFMSLTKISSTVVSAQDEEDLYCRPCNKFFPNIQAYRRHMERTVRHEKLERFAKSAIELSVNASDGVQKDSTLSSVNSQEQDEFNTDKSSIAPVPSMPPNVAPLTTERVFDVTSSTTTTSHLRQKRVQISEKNRRNAYRLTHNDLCNVSKKYCFY